MRERMQGCRSLIVGCGQHPCGLLHQPLHMVDNSHCAWSPVHAQAANIHRFCISIWYILYLGIPQSVCRTGWHQIASPGGIFRLATAPLILYRKTMCNCAQQSVSQQKGYCTHCICMHSRGIFRCAVSNTVHLYRKGHISHRSLSSGEEKCSVKTGW